MVVNLTWVGFKKLFVEMLISKYQELYEEMNLVQMKRMGSYKAYIYDFNVQINATPKMKKFAKNYIIVGGLQKWVVDVLFKFPTLLEDMACIIKIFKSIEADGSKRSGVAPHNKGFEPSYQ